MSSIYLQNNQKLAATYKGVVKRLDWYMTNSLRISGFSSMRRTVTLEDGTIVSGEIIGDVKRFFINSPMFGGVEKEIPVIELYYDVVVWMGISSDSSDIFNYTEDSVVKTTLDFVWPGSILLDEYLTMENLNGKRLLVIPTPSRVLTDVEITYINIFIGIGGRVLINNGFGNTDVVNNINTICEQLNTPMGLRRMRESVLHNWEEYGFTYEDILTSIGGGTYQGTKDMSYGGLVNMPVFARGKLHEVYVTDEELVLTEGDDETGEFFTGIDPQGIGFLYTRIIPVWYAGVISSFGGYDNLSMWPNTCPSDGSFCYPSYYSGETWNGGGCIGILNTPFQYLNIFSYDPERSIFLTAFDLSWLTVGLYNETYGNRTLATALAYLELPSGETRYFQSGNTYDYCYCTGSWVPPGIQE